MLFSSFWRQAGLLKSKSYEIERKIGQKLWMIERFEMHDKTKVVTSFKSNQDQIR